MGDTAFTKLSQGHLFMGDITSHGHLLMGDITF